MFLKFFFLYVMCNDAPLSPDHSSRYLSLLLSETSAHNFSPTKRLSTPSSLSLFFDQQRTDLWLFVVFSIEMVFPLILVFVYLVFFSRKSEAMWTFFHIYCTCPWRTCSSFAIFPRHLVLEPSLWDIVLIFSSFCLTFFFRTNGFLSWGPCMTYLKCWHFKILSQVYFII